MGGAYGVEDTPQPHLQEPTSVHVGISVPACLIVCMFECEVIVVVVGSGSEKESSLRCPTVCIAFILSIYIHKHLKTLFLPPPTVSGTLCPPHT